MKRDTYKVLTERYQAINESYGYNGPQDVTWSKYDNKTQQKIPLATVTFVDGEPKGYEYLGMANSGINIPDANDWLEWSSRMHDHHYLSPSLKVWYSVDSSG